MTDATEMSIGVSARSSLLSKGKRSVPPLVPRTVTDTGSSFGVPPITPATAARRSWVAVPASRPVTPRLNELSWFATTVVIVAVESGSRTSPDWKNGWPKISTRLPSR